MKRNHDRSPDKTGFSVALPKSLVDQLKHIADLEHRSRNGQIELFLEKAVKEWQQSQQKDVPFPGAGRASRGSGSPGDSKQKGA